MTTVQLARKTRGRKLRKYNLVSDLEALKWQTEMFCVFLPMKGNMWVLRYLCNISSPNKQDSLLSKAKDPRAGIRIESSDRNRGLSKTISLLTSTFP